MQPPNTKKSLHLVSPGYRRWLTADSVEVVLECVGLEAKQRRGLDVRTFVRSQENDSETKSVAPLDPDSPAIVLPAPKVHGRGELIVAIEDRRTKEPVVEGRWSFLALSKEEQAATTTFDWRGVCFVGGEATFPVLWAPANPRLDRESLSRIRAAGFDGVVDSRADVPTAETTTAAKEAGSMGLTLLASAVDKAKTEASTVARVRELRNAAAVFAWLIPVTGFQTTAEALIHYRAVRRTDPSRPVVLVGTESSGLGRLSEYEDALLWPAAESKPEPLAAIRRSGWPLFWRIDPGRPFAAAQSDLFHGLSQRCSAVVFEGGSSSPQDASVQKIIREVQSLERLVIRGTPLRIANDLLGIGPCIRSFEEESLVVVSNDTGAEQTIVAAVPGGQSKWIDLRSMSPVKLDAAGGKSTISVVVQPHSSAGFTNAADVIAAARKNR